MDGLTLLEEARKAGLEVRAEGDRLIIRGPKRLEPLARRLMAEKPKVMAALRGEARPAPETSCPTCGIPPDVAETARRKLVLDAALAACEEHLSRCSTCAGWGGPYCGEMERLREAHYRAWGAYYSAPNARRSPQEETRP